MCYLEASAIPFLILEWRANTVEESILQQETGWMTTEERGSPKEDYFKSTVKSWATEERVQCKKKGSAEDKPINAGFISKTKRVGWKSEDKEEC